MNESLIDYTEQYYMNMAQIKSNLIDPNVLLAEIARGGGKTEGIMGPRILRVAQAMPREIGFLVHKTYAELLTNVVPSLLAWFNRPINNGERCMLEEGKDYIVGSSKLPKHFIKPRYPVAYPKHSIIFWDGFNLQLVASDRPASVAGRSGVHAFIEEMKHNKGEKVKTRLFPALRGSVDSKIRNHHLYQGITGVSDTARVDLGEDPWFEEFEANMDEDLIDEIANVAKDVNDALVVKHQFERLQAKKVKPEILGQMYPIYEKALRSLSLWEPRLRDMRVNATYYLRASSFVNKDFLGTKFFRTQLESMTMEEFLTAICGVRIRAVVDRFFANYDPKIHMFTGDESYKMADIMRFDLRDYFTITARYLKHYDPEDELLLGYDPGNFQSLVVAQEKKRGREIRVIKEFTKWSPADQVDMARDFYNFFGEDSQNKHIKLYYDRAGNKTKEEFDQITTDAKILQRELESYGFYVELMNEGQATIYYWQQFKLLTFIFGGRSNSFPFPYICGSQCPDLCSAIMLSPRKQTEGKIVLDKSSEVKVPMKLQGPRSTQLPSALIYLLYGRYADLLPNEFNQLPDNLPENILS